MITSKSLAASVHVPLRVNHAMNMYATIRLAIILGIATFSLYITCVDGDRLHVFTQATRQNLDSSMSLT